MASFKLDILAPARRLRDAVRQIRALPVGDRDKKQILGEWLDEHEGATRDRTSRHRAYNETLGRKINQKLGGGKN